MSDPSKRHLLSEIQTASLLISRGNDKAARDIFNKLSQFNISDPTVLAPLGTLALELGNIPAAIKCFTTIVELEPNNSEYLCMLANTMITNNDLEDAKRILNKAVALEADFADPYKKLGAIAIREGHYTEAVGFLEEAIKLNPRDSKTVSNIIIALRYTDRHDDALAYAKKLIRIDPKNPNSFESLGKVLIELGNREEATAHLKKAIRLDKTRGYSYILLAESRKFSEKDSAFIKQCENTLTLGMPSNQRYLIHFALGKIYDDCKKWDKAFEHYRQGNLLHKPAADQDKVLLNRVRKTRKYYNKELFEKVKGLGSESETPVFVVGMPRSGTTLIEQIICSHPQGAAAGELKEIAHVAAQIFPSDSLSDYGKQLHNFLNIDAIRQYTDSYLQVLKNNRQHATRIVDKMPDNFFRLGLIHLLFPKAHIIHAIRNPLDTCLSCYFRPFTFVYWTYDIKWISTRYRFYRETMENWKKVLPANTIIDVDYDRLIEDPSSQTRRIIEKIGLPWDEHCLEFYKKQRAITTESVWQVRQPIYTSSSKRWMNYAQYLEQLANELSDYLQPEDIEILKDHGITTTPRKWGWNNLRNALAK